MRWQKVTFTAAYPGPRMAAYLFFPRNASAPFEPIILWPPSNALTDRQFNPDDSRFAMFTGFIPRSGRMIVLPVLMGTFERDDSLFSITRSTPDSTTLYRDNVVKWVNDVRRTIDFLETRKDIRSDRIGFYGGSWGGAAAPYVLAIEPRIKVALLYSAGFANAWSRSEAESFNYAPRVHTPTLMLNGRFDTVFPYETSQTPFYQLLGTKEPDKRLTMSNTGHILPLAQTEAESLKWLDRYLSGKADIPGTVATDRR
jgi:dienelactone hydrolase